MLNVDILISSSLKIQQPVTAWFDPCLVFSHEHLRQKLLAKAAGPADLPPLVHGPIPTACLPLLPARVNTSRERGGEGA